MTDHVERLRGLARLDWPAEVQLLVGTLTEDELDRLGDLLRAWPPERGWPPPRARCGRALTGWRAVHGAGDQPAPRAAAEGPSRAEAARARAAQA